MSKINGNDKLITWVLAIALFMETLDVTIISISIPQIALDLQSDPISLKLALTSYLISLAIFIPISSWLSDKYGSRTVFCTALALFLIGSVLCGISQSLLHLIISRTIQGIGGGIMMPVGRLIFLRTFSKAELIKANNYVVIPSLIGPALGPVLGGIIATYSSWRWIFYINVPFGLVGIYLSFKYCKNYISNNIQAFDVIGFVFFCFGLAGLSFVLEAFSEDITSTLTLLIIILMSLSSLFFYFIHSKKHGYPLLDLSIFKIRTFRVTTLGSFLGRTGLGGIPFLLPLFFQTAFDLPPIEAGLIIFPLALGMIIMKFFVKRILTWFTFKEALVGNTVILGISIILFSTINLETHYYIIILSIFFHGMLSSLQFSCMNILSYVDLSQPKMGNAISISSAIQQLSMSFGVAISAFLLKLWLDNNSGFAIGFLPFHKTFVVIGSITLLSSLIFFKLNNDDGNSTRFKHSSS